MKTKNEKKIKFLFHFKTKIEKSQIECHFRPTDLHQLMRVWKVSFDFQFKIEMKIEKIVIFDFCSNIEFLILSPNGNAQLQFSDWKRNFQIIIF